MALLFTGDMADLEEVEHAPLLERARGRVSLHVGRRLDRNVVAGLAQAGCGRLLFPAVTPGASLEAVVVNTSGGLTGGDRFAADVEAGTGASAVVTTQACERIYRSSGGRAAVSNRLVLHEGASLAWLPQETILFQGSRLARRLEIDLAADASLLVAEAVLLGRRASGERLTAGTFRDSWRVRRAGRLVFADETRLDGDLAGLIGAPALLGGAGAFATVLLASPDAAQRCAAARDALAGRPAANGDAEIGLTAFEGLCVARLIAQDGVALRRTLLPLLERLGARIPLVWSL